MPLAVTVAHLTIQLVQQCRDDWLFNYELVSTLLYCATGVTHLVLIMLYYKGMSFKSLIYKHSVDECYMPYKPCTW